MTWKTVALSILALVICCLCLTGCGSVLSIHEGPLPGKSPADVQDVKGVPFYARKPRVVRETTWREDLREVKVTVIKAPSGSGGKPTTLLSRSVLISRTLFEHFVGGMSDAT